MADYAHILLAIDFTPATDSVTARAMNLCQSFQARLSLVHVVEFTSIDLSGEIVMPQDMEIDELLLDQAKTRLQELAVKLGVERSDYFIRQGSTRQEILDLAAERNVDLIIVGSHGRQGIQRLLGSTANSVLHGAPCDVLAVRIKDD